MIGKERKDEGEEIWCPGANARKDDFKSRLGIAGQG
jgi:hypothetical protein